VFRYQLLRFLLLTPEIWHPKPDSEISA